MSDPATYAACLTPPGAGAIAVIVVYGPQAISAVETLFCPLLASDGSPNPSLARRANDGRFFLGRFGDDIADHVVVSVKQTAPVPQVEIHCHGGMEVVRLLLEALQRRGVEICSWQHLETITTDDPLRAAAAIALAEARTTRTAAILLDQYHGAFARALGEIVAAFERDDTETAGRHLGELMQFADLGRHLVQPWRVVVAGAPNVGKSSLVNALAGYRRAVVSAVPGTTRDLVTTEIAVDGWPVELTDTAGMCDGGEELEVQGIAQARKAAAAADLCLWVLEGSAPPVWPPFAFEKLRLVVNKVDLPEAWDRSAAEGALPISAATGEGVPELCAALACWLVPVPPAPGAALPFTPELCDGLEEIWRQHAAGNQNEARRLLFRLRFRVSREAASVPNPPRNISHPPLAEL